MSKKSSLIHACDCVILYPCEKLRVRQNLIISARARKDHVQGDGNIYAPLRVRVADTQLILPVAFEDSR
jgi:hypothetical protein